MGHICVMWGGRCQGKGVATGVHFWVFMVPGGKGGLPIDLSVAVRWLMVHGSGLDHVTATV
jgi:hypothetical protein